MDQRPKDKERLIAEELEEVLTSGEMEREGIVEGARNRLIPKVEIRIQAKIDPIREETRIVKKMIVEENERYNRYDQEK
jgi:hypothetical protein